MPKLPKLYRDATTGQYTTAEDAAARPAETVAETTPPRHEAPDVAELRDQIAGTIHRRICEHSREDCIENLGDCERATDSAMPLVSTALDKGHVLARLLACALNDAIRTLRELAEKAAGGPIPFDDFDLYAEVVDGALDAANDAGALRAELAHQIEARDNARAERDALRTWQERVAVAAGIGEEVEGRGVYLEANPDAAAEHVAGLLAVADTHIECPVYCGGCGEPLADALCDHCSGSGCGPGTALGAYEECGWCAGAGKVHPGCADLSYADLVAERDALAAKVAALADWHETKAEKARRFRIEIDGRNPVMDKAAEVHTDAARRLRAALDEEPQP